MTDPRSTSSSMPAPTPGTAPAAEPTARHEITTTVNGQSVTAEVESRLLLTDFLRHRLRLTGTHVGCEQGACGACTIQLDGRAVRSCLMLAVQADGREIRTIEGLADPDGELTVVQQAFADQHGLQCGFCTPGFVLSLQTLVDRGQPVSEAELDECVDSSYCRCTGYVNIRSAARQALGLTPGPDAGSDVIVGCRQAGGGADQAIGDGAGYLFLQLGDAVDGCAEILGPRRLAGFGVHLADRNPDLPAVQRNRAIDNLTNIQCAAELTDGQPVIGQRPCGVVGDDFQ